MSVMDFLIGVVAPPECVECHQEGSALCDVCRVTCARIFTPTCFKCGRLSEAVLTCQNCRKHSHLLAAYPACAYSPTIKALLRRYKFDHQRAAVSAITDMMVANAGKYLSYVPRGSWVIAMPSATSHSRERGFDHSALLAREVARRLKMPFVPALRRHGQARQVGAQRRERLSQLHKTMYVPPRYINRLKGRSALLIDDIATTGASLEEAARTLRQAGSGGVMALTFTRKELGR